MSTIADFTSTYDPTTQITTQVATFEASWSPRVTITRTVDSSGAPSPFVVVVGLEDLDPQRDVTLEETGAGISSLNPPTVTVRPLQTARATHRDLMRAVLRAVTTAVWETPRTDFTARQRGMAGQVWIVLRTSWAVRRALRLMGEDI